MKNVQEATTNWLSQLDGEEVVFASDRLGKTIAYLKAARAPGQGWGPYPKSASDLHHTALVLQALHYSRDKSVEATIADAASYVRKLKSDHLDTLNLEDATNMLLIVRSEQRRGNEGYVNQLIASLHRAYTTIMNGSTGISMRQLTSSLLAVLELGRNDLEMVKTWTDRLLDLQHPDGGWPTVNENSSSVVATAMSLQVLNRLTGDRIMESLRRGLLFVGNQLTEKTWKNLGMGGDTLSTTTVLRALAETPIADYSWTKQGVDLLFTRMNPDGSWGDGPGEPGNVENTALCLLALAAAGQTRFVPARLAKVAITEVQSHLSQITDERDKLRQDIETRVNEVSDNLFRERNDLLVENENLKVRLKSIQDETQAARSAREAAEYRSLAIERELDLLRSVSSRSAQPTDSVQLGPLVLPAFTVRILTLLVAPLVFLSGVAWYLLLPPRQTWSTVIAVAAIVLAAVIAGFAVFAIFENRRSRQWQSPYLDVGSTRSEVSFLRRTFSRMTSTWDPYISEELAYRLNDIGDMSSEVAGRYTEDLATKLRLEPEQEVELLSWVNQVTRLDPVQRRVLLTQLQRSHLGS